MKQWNADEYEGRFAYVWKAASDLVELLAPDLWERILDLGCGTGHLSAKIAEQGARVTGIDASAAMIAKAQHAYPQIRFEVGDARTYRDPQPYDAVFSNAALHWIKEADQVAGTVYDLLKPGGRFVAEFGGRGNIQALHAACEKALRELKRSIPALPAKLQPWYFPSLAQYARLLERHRLEVTYGVLFDRPTALDGGERGLREWLQMFGEDFLKLLPADRQESFFVLVESYARPQLYRHGRWFADYRRLRVIARKPEGRRRSFFPDDD